ncbi:MAG: hypothetical protein K9H25_16095 [Rhodospirillum sp.]|nr:hypothetical protein [Rhodospirillum sp.]MCF8489673.1 hypothetical protein [Rhodospirillum sp.]MCF8501487.1 hypothetical protein [Rhodospirillum sp.]
MTTPSNAPIRGSLLSARLALAALIGLAATVLPPSPTKAADKDPDWPCVQRRAGALSPGVLWPAPLDAAAPLAREAQDLGAALALRRVDMEDAKARVEHYAAAHPDLDMTELGAIFLEAFKRIDHDRTRLLSGIVRYSRGQVALSKRIAQAQAEFDSLEQAEKPDFDRLDALEEQLDWDKRIYSDREKSLTYVCETPVLLEKRAYAVARLLQEQAP